MELIGANYGSDSEDPQEGGLSMIYWSIERFLALRYWLVIKFSEKRGRYFCPFVSKDEKQVADKLHNGDEITNGCSELVYC